MSTDVRRRNLLLGAAGLAAGAALGGSTACRSGQVVQKAGTAAVTTTRASAASRMPVLFIGHGSPMNAIENNRWSEGFRKIAALLPRPKAILSVSAHWFVPGTHTTGNDRPETIHDFGGFPKELFDVQYPAAGAPELARRVVGLLGAQASVTTDWGLDHGTWTVLRYLVPDASVPVVQLSIDRRLAPAKHLELARSLAPLRDEGVLLMGSGNVTHNLPHAMMSMQMGDVSTPPWAASFDKDVAKALEQHDGDALASMLQRDDGRRSHPTPDHYLPIIYAAGASAAADAVHFPVDGFDLGSLSMRSALFS